MKWKTAVKLVGEEADEYLNQLSIDRWMIKSVTPLWNGDLENRENIVIGIVACQSPEYEKKGKLGKKKATE